ncbi:MAG: hypothetical protein ACE5E1_06315 [Phycisphaerae bacterium]
MGPKLFETALEEAIRFGAAARMVLTFPGNEDALHVYPLAYSRIGETGFRIEIRVSDLVDADMVDDVVFLDSTAIESAELQVKQKGKVWQDEPYEDIPGAED